MPVGLGHFCCWMRVWRISGFGEVEGGGAFEVGLGHGDEAAFVLGNGFEDVTDVAGVTSAEFGAAFAEAEAAEEFGAVGFGGDAASEGDDPAVEEVARRHELATEIVDDEDAVIGLHLERGGVDAGGFVEAKFEHGGGSFTTDDDARALAEDPAGVGFVVFDFDGVVDDEVKDEVFADTEGRNGLGHAGAKRLTGVLPVWGRVANVNAH